MKKRTKKYGPVSLSFLTLFNIPFTYRSKMFSLRLITNYYYTSNPFCLFFTIRLDYLLDYRPIITIKSRKILYTR